MLNIRLAKNGGLLRSLKLIDQAEVVGLDYCLGCHVGETGILSALGRVAASLIPNPRYVDGSYDTLLLSGNITSESFGFGLKGEASIIRNRGIGFDICGRKLSQYAQSTSDIQGSE